MEGKKVVNTASNKIGSVRAVTWSESQLIYVLLVEVTKTKRLEAWPTTYCEVVYE